MPIANTPTLRLQRPDAESDAYRLERRIAQRHSIAGRVTAVQTHEQADGQLSRICSLQLMNISDTGLGALSEESIEPGSSLAVFFPPHGPERGIDLVGQVVRCVARENGHEIGIRLEARAAA
jgi:hypothetical protein